MKNANTMNTTGLKQLTGLKQMWIAKDNSIDATALAAGSPAEFDDAAIQQTQPPIDIVLRSNPTKRTFLNAISIKAITEHITRLPSPGETIHGVVSGRYPLWAFIPAILSITGDTIADLQLATLSFSTDNGAELIDLLDANKIKAVTLACSHYFRYTNKHIYDPIAAALKQRGQRIRGLRTHAKIINAKMQNGTCYTVESSANLKSSHNQEQFTLSSDAALFDFHKQWIEKMYGAIGTKDRE